MKPAEGWAVVGPGGEIVSVAAGSFNPFVILDDDECRCIRVKIVPVEESHAP